MVKCMSQRDIKVHRPVGIQVDIELDSELGMVAYTCFFSTREAKAGAL